MEHRIELGVLRERVGDHKRPADAERSARVHDRGHLVSSVDSPVDADTGIGEVEPRKLVGAETDDPDVECL